MQVCIYEGVGGGIRLDVFQHIRRACVLANIVAVLDRSLRPDHEAPNPTHDQV